MVLVFLLRSCEIIRIKGNSVQLHSQLLVFLLYPSDRNDQNPDVHGEKMGNSMVINWSYIVNYVISENMSTKESSVYETVY